MGKRKGVELFDKATFEKALPMKRDGSGPAWRCIGMDKGEYAYLLGLGNKPASVYVRSSVDSTGWSAATGEDSIRVFVVESIPTCNVCYRKHDDAPNAPKCGLPPCPGCNCNTLKELVVKKEGPNKGRKFFKCGDESCGFFQWADETE